MIVQFVDRQEELETLNTIFAKKAPALILLYGRRRIGKTRLLQEFLKNQQGLYFYIPNAEEKTILAELSRTIQSEFFEGFKFPDFNSFMEYLTQKSQRRVVIAIDEFQRLTNCNGAISILQKYWDEKLTNTGCFIILSGSSIGAIRRVALSGNAPLYGRRTATLKLEPLKFLDLFQWFKKYSTEDLVKVYGSFGGTPAYLQHMEEAQTVEDNIIEKILNKRSPLYSEPETLLMEEIRTPQRYMDILSAIAQGKTKISEIADATGLTRENITTYLKTLEILDLIERKTPITEPEAKKGIYKIRDPFFNLWFRFVKPNKRQLELELEKNLWENIEREFNTYLGLVFEEICLQTLAEMATKNALPIKPDRIGKWWWKDTEIDLLALETKEKRALAIETKWTKLTHQEAKKLLSELDKKTQQIPNMKEHVLGIMAKEIENKEKIRNEGIIAIDLQDIENLAKRKTRPQH